MCHALVSEIVELFGCASDERNVDWKTVVANQRCPLLGKKCFKVRKSSPETSIGTCTVLHGRAQRPLLICPARLLQGRQIFADCLNLLNRHESGNELHIVPEVSVPGGSVDYFLVSARGMRVYDFVGIELQTLDTTGTIWPERQRLLARLGVPSTDQGLRSGKAFGMNWKHTAKTTLVQLHHKTETFEHVDKRLVLVLQDQLLDYMMKEFNFRHLTNPAQANDSMHFHAYGVNRTGSSSYDLKLQSTLSTDAKGIATCLGLQIDAHLELAEIETRVGEKIGASTLFRSA